ncbi:MULTISPECIES: sigma-70 family RNA polymerase sigma factor [unclassified Serinicoccus]|uniref:sigma-70 family RNA polymerase sigma factor n=1 Tax=unclassified Serinicoccus TaxID=2643101 RepID=UPI003853BB84
MIQHSPAPPGLALLGPREARTLTEHGEFDVRRAFHEHGQVILGFAVNALEDRHAAEDCLQETLVRAWRARDRYSAERGSERTWLMSIARNVVIDTHRARVRRPAQPHAELPEPPSTAVPGVDAGVVDRVTLMSGLAQLSREHREVVVAVHLHGLRYEELTRVTGVPVGTLRSRMYYALRALRGIVGEEVEEHGR